MITGISALLAALCLSGAALAQSAAAPRWGLPELMRELHAVTSAQGKFVETKYLAVLSAPLELSGTLAYRAPDRLEKHTLKPVAERLVLEGNTLTIEDGRRRRSYALERNPTMRAFVESMRSTLAGDLQTLERFYEVSLEGERGKWRLALKPSDAAMQSFVREILIKGRGVWVDTIELLDPNGDRSVMNISPESP
jgi:hypothetical protein